MIGKKEMLQEYAKISTSSNEWIAIDSSIIV